MLTATAARAGYTAGWAASGGPVTARVLAGARACQDLHEHLTEDATLRLGHLEGVWAAIYDRREQLLTQGVARAVAVWTANPPDLAELVRTVRVNMGLGEATPEVPPAITGLAAQALLRQNARADLALVVAEGFAAAHAEGKVGALALAADHAGLLGFDFDLAFTDAVDALASLDPGYWTEAVAEYVQQAVRGTVQDVGRVLAQQVTDQAPYEDMLSAVEGLFSNSTAVSYFTDLALSTGLTQGALSLYGSEGVELVEFVTAGDARVCAPCEEAETGNPYRLDDLPAPPLHGRCRCCVQATDVSRAAFMPYVTDVPSEGQESDL